MTFIRNAFTLLFCFLPFLILGQELDANFDTEKKISLAKATYAVVVGVSDYQHPAIPDLHFAHKDAEEFAQFLQSPGGGNLPNNHIKLLVNEKATYAQLVSAMDWLMEVTEEGQNAIIYFSGHGDVETLTRSQLGFLLVWDSPPQSYMAGAFPLFYLKEVIQTLSLDKKARVFMISDACRSGNLAGSQVSGSQLTSTNLAQQFAKEVKILSCQPNEYSIEGEQWGGGRGLFSFFLTDGLYGKADSNDDGAINLMEIGRYLEDHVTSEAAPHTQLPMTVGNRLEKLAVVYEDMLTALKQPKKTVLAYSSTLDKGTLDELVLNQATESSRVLYQRFQKALSDQVFLEPAEACANSYYNQLAADSNFAALHSTLKRDFVAAMQDEVQQALNALLESDPYEVNRFFFHPERYSHYPEYLQRSIELAEEDHFAISSLKAKKNFFEAINKHRILSESSNIGKPQRDSLHYLASALLDDAIALEPLGAYLYYGKGLFHTFYVPAEIDSVIFYSKKALELSPKWLLPYLTIASEYLYNLRDYSNAEKWLEKAHQIDPESYVVMERLCWIYGMLDRSSDALGLAEKMLELRPDLFNSYANMGGVNLSMENYLEAEKWYKKSIEIESAPTSFAHIFIGQIYFATRRANLGKKHYDQQIADPGTPYWVKGRLHAFYGAALTRFTNDWSLAEQHLRESRKLLNLPPEHAEAYTMAAKAKIHQGKWEEAEVLLNKALDQDTASGPIILAYALLGEIRNQEGQVEKAEYWFKKSIAFSSGVYVYDMNFRKEALFLYGVFLKSQNRLEEAEDLFQQCVEYIHGNGYYGYFGLSLLAAQQNDIPLALDQLEKALDNWLPLVIILRNESLLMEIKETDRFKTLLKKHFPNYKYE